MLDDPNRSNFHPQRVAAQFGNQRELIDPSSCSNICANKVRMRPPLMPPARA